MKNTSEENGTKEARNSAEEYRIWKKEQRIKFKDYIKPYLEIINQQSHTANINL